jgi:simple sugar transport system permease protein
MIQSLIWGTLYYATPLTLAAMGGVLSEKAGVVNIALEGFILSGAFTGVCAADITSRYGAVVSGIAGVVAAIVVGAILGLLHAFLTQKTRMDHVVSGLGINLLASGATQYLYLHVYPQGVTVTGIPRWMFLLAAVILPFAVQWTLIKTHWGLKLRAVGESPEGAFMAGVSSLPVRIAAVTLSGVLAALGGAYLSLADDHNFSTDVSAGKGYIALAAVIFGKWNPLGAAGGALFFGFFYALQTELQIRHIDANFLGISWTNSFLLDMLPYVMTIVALASVIGRAVPPASLGKEEPAE